ncbi:hypothetical protein AYL99_09762 [Fonsecaea erecta]|uniref:Uncharacterized protein n=1 Tax=Fonsecaea erecta TaxID=1367422 RepID=A0A178Z7Z4_9EURO|nr:hypothetical protein AYL99_09762 [Fonsecaea erecta]OAP55611.1 hypothetical protein AYL99_09762 [Fonsecaea erecta]
MPSVSRAPHRRRESDPPAAVARPYTANMESYIPYTPQYDSTQERNHDMSIEAHTNRVRTILEERGHLLDLREHILGPPQTDATMVSRLSYSLALFEQHRQDTMLAERQSRDEVRGRSVQLRIESENLQDESDRLAGQAERLRMEFQRLDGQDEQFAFMVQWIADNYALHCRELARIKKRMAETKSAAPVPEK